MNNAFLPPLPTFPLSPLPVSVVLWLILRGTNLHGLLLSGSQTLGPFVCKMQTVNLTQDVHKLFWVINRKGKYLSFLRATNDHVVNDFIWALNSTPPPEDYFSLVDPRSRLIHFALRGRMWSMSSVKAQNRCYVFFHDCLCEVAGELGPWTSSQAWPGQLIKRWSGPSDKGGKSSGYDGGRWAVPKAGGV